MTANKKRTPERRFKEFRDSEEWEEKKLGEIGNIIQGVGFPMQYQGRSSGEYPFCKVSDISAACEKNSGYLSQASNYINTKDVLLLKAKVLPKGSTIFAKIGEAVRLNRRAILEVDAIVDNNCCCIKLNSDNNCDLYLFFYMQTIDFNLYALSGTIPSINKSTIQNINIPLPSLPEQQKIADCLLSLDELIGLEKEKLEKLKEYKKGLLQNLFPKENQKVPDLRFKEFLGSGEWEEKKLGEVVFIERGGSPRPIDEFITNDKNGLNWVRIGDAPDTGNLITQTAKKIRPEGLCKTREVHPGDLILSNSMSFGKPYIMGISGCIHDGWLLIRNEKGVFDLKFLCQLLGTEQTLKQYHSLAAGSTVRNLNKELVGNSVVKFPTMLEQQALGNLFSSLDDLIAEQTEKINDLKEYKKGLMQQLFPSEDIS